MAIGLVEDSTWISCLSNEFDGTMMLAIHEMKERQMWGKDTELSLDGWNFGYLWPVQTELSKEQLSEQALAQETYPGEK